MKKHIIIVSDEHFITHLKVFTDTIHCKVSKTIIEDDMFKDDAIWLSLYRAKKESSDKLMNYEFDKRNNFKR